MANNEVVQQKLDAVMVDFEHEDDGFNISQRDDDPHAHAPHRAEPLHHVLHPAPASFVFTVHGIDVSKIPASNAERLEIIQSFSGITPRKTTVSRGEKPYIWVLVSRHQDLAKLLAIDWNECDSFLPAPGKKLEVRKAQKRGKRTVLIHDIPGDVDLATLAAFLDSQQLIVNPEMDPRHIGKVALADYSAKISFTDPKSRTFLLARGYLPWPAKHLSLRVEDWISTPLRYTFCSHCQKLGCRSDICEKKKAGNPATCRNCSQARHDGPCAVHQCPVCEEDRDHTANPRECPKYQEIAKLKRAYFREEARKSKLEAKQQRQMLNLPPVPEHADVIPHDEELHADNRKVDDAYVQYRDQHPYPRRPVRQRRPQVRQGGPSAENPDIDLLFNRMAKLFSEQKRDTEAQHNSTIHQIRSNREHVENSLRKMDASLATLQSNFSAVSSRVESLHVCMEKQGSELDNLKHDILLLGKHTNADTTMFRTGPADESNSQHRRKKQANNVQSQQSE